MKYLVSLIVVFFISNLAQAKPIAQPGKKPVKPIMKTPRLDCQLNEYVTQMLKRGRGKTKVVVKTRDEFSIILEKVKNNLYDGESKLVYGTTIEGLLFTEVLMSKQGPQATLQYDDGSGKIKETDNMGQKGQLSKFINMAVAKRFKLKCVIIEGQKTTPGSGTKPTLPQK